MKDNNKMNYTISRHPEGDNPKDLSTQSHVITRNNVEQVAQKPIQSDVVIPNKLGNCETCLGLRHWRLLSNLKNNFSRPVRNDMISSLAPCGTLVEPTNEVELSETACRMAEWLGRGENSLQNAPTTCAPLVGEPKSLISKGGKNVVNCKQEPSPEFVSSPQLTNKFYPLTKREGKENRKGLINLSTHRLIDFKEILRLKPQNDINNIKILVPQCPSALVPLVTNLFPYFPISFSPNKKLRRFRIKSGMTFIKQPAFTLAEVLITLGIIGVVAAITIPGLINNYKAQRLRSQFLESYSIVQQVFKQMEADDISLNPADYPTNSFYKVFMRYLQAPTNCTNKTFSKVCYGASGGSSANSPYKTFDGNSDVNPRIFDDGEILLQNGMLLLIENNAEGKNSDRLWISVDLNGYKTPPNRWGYDLFTFQFVEGELKTMGQDGTDYTDMNVFCNEKSKSDYNGITCAQKAKTDTDYFKSVVKSVK